MTPMRMFAALLPPPTIEAEIEAAVQRLRSRPDADRLRWTDPSSRHLTVAFYGATDPAVVPDLCARLTRAARRTEPFDVRLAGGGQFDGGTDRTLWAAVSDGRTGLAWLAARATGAGRRVGIVPPGLRRRHHPHLTLARTRRGQPPLDGYVTALDADLQTDRWRVDRLVLIHSVLPSGGTPGERPRYETVAVFRLGH